MIRTEEEHLAHYGILRRSGRYPWGSGGTENTRNKKFLDVVNGLREEGLTEAEIAKGFGITTTELRTAKSRALAQQKQQKILTAERLREHGLSNVAIGQRMGLNESSVRALLAPGAKDKADALQSTANMLKEQVARKKYIDVGSGVESQLGITHDRLKTAVAMLREEGYEVHTIKVKQLGTGKFTNVKVLASPNTSFGEVSQNRAQIKQITDYSTDHGRTFLGAQPPISVNSKRIAINYAEDGGAKADGVIYVRPGVKDLSLGSNRYAQVRVAVDGTHYLKGMALYKDDLPDGVDLVFNTNKPRGSKDVLKEMSDDPDMPFGAIVRQIHGPDGKVSSAMNMVNEEGTWDKYSRNLASQMLSKQNPSLARKQLDLTYERNLREFNEITSLTNPTVRKKLLVEFGDKLDASAVHLEAAAMRGQTTRVLLPISSMKDTEVYDPSKKDGDRVVLIRYPHGGTFEIPELTVNNRNREARKLLGTSPQDAIGINSNVAKRLSGADFDGDFVLVIPNNKGSVKSTPALKDLKDFDPIKYKLPDDSPIPRIDSVRKGREMGRVSNLITDMTIRGADAPELARAVKHSMVVIDSEKHNLDFRQSEIDNGIPALMLKYQSKKRGGAYTLLSRATAEIRIPEREARKPYKGGPIDPVTGKKVYEPTGRMIRERKVVVDPVTKKRTYVFTGRVVPATMKTERLAVADDAFSLIPKDRAPTVMETIYAEHSNKLKAMANASRKEAVVTKNAPYSASARKVYANEVASLKSKLNLAKKNAPLERQAQVLAGALVAQKRAAHPDMDAATETKVRQQALNDMRNRVGAKKTKIVITQSEWDAIQAGAISTHMLTNIMTNSDTDTIKRLAMPKQTGKITSTMMSRAKSMLDSGYTQAEVADHLGVGLTTLKLALNG